MDTSSLKRGIIKREKWSGVAIGRHTAGGCIIESQKVKLTSNLFV